LETLLAERLVRAVKITGGRQELEPLKSVLESSKNATYKSIFLVRSNTWSNH
jgi:hypothetical protein